MKRALFLSIVPLDSEGNDIRPTVGDTQFIVEKFKSLLLEVVLVSISLISLSGENT